MKTLDNNEISSKLDGWYAFQDSLNWNNNQVQCENVHETFLDALKCGVSRDRAFNVVAARINRTGKTIATAVMYEIWHAARCKWQARQHGQRNILPMLIRPEVNGNGACKMDQVLQSANISKNEVDADIVIDGLNVIYGTPSHQRPCLMNLLGLLPALQQRKYSFKCYFDASTPYKLADAGKQDEADAYLQLCYDYPDTFIEVPGRSQADAFLLQYAHNKGTRVISNDCFRDYYRQYHWLEEDYQRRIPFVVHSNEMQIPALNLVAEIPEDLSAGQSTLRTGFGKPAVGVPKYHNSKSTPAKQPAVNGATAPAMKAC